MLVLEWLGENMLPPEDSTKEEQSLYTLWRTPQVQVYGVCHRCCSGKECKDHPAYRVHKNPGNMKLVEKHTIVMLRFHLGNRPSRHRTFANSCKQDTTKARQRLKDVYKQCFTNILLYQTPPGK